MLAVGGSIEDAISTMRWGLATKRATGAEIKVPYYLGLLRKRTGERIGSLTGSACYMKLWSWSSEPTNGGTRRSCIGSWPRC